jgi:hypothetical protein
MHCVRIVNRPMRVARRAFFAIGPFKTEAVSELQIVFDISHTVLYMYTTHQAAVGWRVLQLLSHSS